MFDILFENILQNYLDFFRN